jgi:sugar phosphate isomerase/epimerase
MCVAMQLLREYGRRIRQVHVSEVDTQSHHRPVTLGVGLAFEKIRMDMPGDVPFIIESVVTEAMIACELRRVREYFAEPAYATPSLTD